MTPPFHPFLWNPGNSRLSPKAILIEKNNLFLMSIVSTRKALEGPFKFILFSEKLNFRPKFMVFSKIFFAQKIEHKKLH